MPNKKNNTFKFLFIIYCFFFICAFSSITIHQLFIHLQKTTLLEKKNLDNLAVYLNSKLDSPDIDLKELYSKNVLVYITDQATGAMILDREKKDNYWRMYKSKIVFEMQKFKEGWISYPENTYEQNFESVRHIRFLYNRQLKSIIAVESLMPGYFYQLKEMVSIRFLLQFLVLIVLGFIVNYILLKKFYYLFNRPKEEKPTQTTVEKKPKENTKINETKKTVDKEATAEIMELEIPDDSDANILQIVDDIEKGKTSPKPVDDEIDQSENLPEVSIDSDEEKLLLPTGDEESVASENDAPLFNTSSDTIIGQAFTTKEQNEQNNEESLVNDENFPNASVEAYFEQIVKPEETEVAAELSEDKGSVKEPSDEEDLAEKSQDDLDSEQLKKMLDEMKED